MTKKIPWKKFRVCSSLDFDDYLLQISLFRFFFRQSIQMN